MMPQNCKVNDKEPNLRNNSGENQRPQPTKLSPLCFACNDFRSNFFLEIAKRLTLLGPGFFAFYVRVGGRFDPSTLTANNF